MINMPRYCLQIYIALNVLIREITVRKLILCMFICYKVMNLLVELRSLGFY